MNQGEKVIRSLLAEAQVEVNGSRPWDLQVKNPAFYGRVLRDRELGLGESYMDGWWEVESLDQFIHRVLRADLEHRLRKSWRLWWPALSAVLFNQQSRRRAFQVGEEHYDLGNDLYEAMLDRHLNYTCAYWREGDDLDAAQEHKLDLVCRKLGLEPGMEVLELGCGWGAFAGYAAEKYGVRVRGVTVSREQVEWARNHYGHLPVEITLSDYREVEGQYDRVLSIGIMEHVGYKNYRTYMEVVKRTLKPDGVAFIHTIGGNVSVHSVNPWTGKYIFPNGMLPSISQLGSAMEGLFVMEDWHNLGPHYDRTLMAWYDNFRKAWPQLERKYGERFRRMWEFYLLSSAACFRSRTTQLWQIVMTPVGSPQPPCRIS